MASNSFKIEKSLTLKPQASAPTNPEIGDFYVDLQGTFWKYDGNNWVKVGSNEVVEVDLYDDIVQDLTDPVLPNFKVDDVTPTIGTEVLFSNLNSDHNQIYSLDGIDTVNWSAQSAAEANWWRSVTWSPELGLFVAVAASGTNRVMTSPDGVNWSAQSAAEANFWTSVTWSPELGLFVAVANSGANQVMTSPDGTNWSAQSAASNSAWLSVTWSPELSLFVAVANSGTNRVMTSPDGTNWSAQSAASNSAWISVTWSPELGLFVAVASGGTNRVMTSPDGVNWSAQSATEANEWRSVTWSPELGLFVAVANDGANQVMTYSGLMQLTWSPKAVFSNSSVIPSIGDTVSVSSGVKYGGNLATFNGTKFLHQVAAFNIDVSSPEDGNALVYDSSTDTWKPGQGAGGGGLGAVNFNTNPNATSGVDLSEPNGIGDYVASGTGVAVSKATTDLPMGSLRATGVKLTFTDDSGAEEYVRLRFRVPETFRGMINQIAWRQALDSYVSGSAKIELYSYSDAYANGETQVNLLYRDSNGDSLIKDSPEFYEEFLADPTREYYELRFINDGATAGSITMNDVLIGPDTRIMGAVDTEWIEYPGKFVGGTSDPTYVSANLKTWYKQVGSDIILRAEYIHSTAATAGSGTYYLTYPDGFTPDSQKLGGLVGAGGVNASGSGRISKGPGSALPFGGQIHNTGVRFYLGDSVSNNSVWQSSSSYDFTEPLLRLSYTSSRIPVAEWRGKGTTQMLSQERLYANAKFRVVSDSTASVNNNNTVTTQWNTVQWNNVNATFSSGLYTVKADGKYRVTAQLDGTGATAIQLFVRKNQSLNVAAGVLGSGFVTATIDMVAGDTLSILRAGGGTLTLSGNTLTNYFEIERISDYSHGTGVGLGLATADKPGLAPKVEILSAKSSQRGSITSALSLAWLQMTGNSITLTPGIWQLNGEVRILADSGSNLISTVRGLWTLANGADTTITPTTIDAIRLDQTFLGNSDSGIFLDANMLFRDWTMPMSTAYINVTSTTTVYLVPHIVVAAGTNHRVQVALKALRLAGG